MAIIEIQKKDISKLNRILFDLNWDIDGDTLDGVDSTSFLSYNKLKEILGKPIINTLKTISKPIINQPLNNDNNVTSRLIQSSAYAPLNGYNGPHTKTEWLLSSGSSFYINSDPNNILKTKWWVTTLNNFTNYKLSVRYISDNHVSEWSDTIEFITGKLINIFGPIITSTNGNDVLSNRRISIDPLTRLEDLNDVHISTDWFIIDKQSNEIIFESINDDINLTELTIPFNIVINNKEYVIKVRINGNEYITDYSEHTIQTNIDIMGNSVNFISDLPFPLADHQQTTLPNGNVIVTGGINLTGISNKTLLWNKETNIWSELADIPYPIFSHKQISISDNEIMLIGGSTTPNDYTNYSYSNYWYYYSGTSHSISNKCILYNIEKNTWTELTNIPKPIHKFGISSVNNNNEIIITGGLTMIYNNINFNSEVLKYNIPNNKWTTISAGALNTYSRMGIYSHQQFTLNDDVIIHIGGRNPLPPVGWIKYWITTYGLDNFVMPLNETSNQGAGIIYAADVEYPGKQILLIGGDYIVGKPYIPPDGHSYSSYHSHTSSAKVFRLNLNDLSDFTTYEILPYQLTACAASVITNVNLDFNTYLGTLVTGGYVNDSKVPTNKCFII